MELTVPDILPLMPTKPTIQDLYAELRELLKDSKFVALGTNTSDYNTLVRAISEIRDLRERAQETTWRNVADEPPPLGISLLFWRGGVFWVGRAEEVTVHEADGDGVEKHLEIAYYCDDDYDDGDPPVAWCYIPAGEDEDGSEGEE